MRIIAIFILFLFANCLTFTQQLTLKKIDEVPAYLQQLKDLQIKLSSKNIDIRKSGESVFSEAIYGQKILKISPAQKYFLIADFNFTEDKTDYKISVIVFDEKGSIFNRVELKSFFDLPHPLISINDNGVISAFDPYKFELNIFEGDVKNKINLEKDMPSEIERASFVEMNNEDVYILSSIEPLSIGNSETNANLYKINLDNYRVVEKKVDYSTPVLLKLIDDQVIISGIKFNNSVAMPNISIMNSRMEVLKETNLAAEKFINFDSDYIIKYGSAVYKLDKNLNKESEYFFTNNERIEDFAVIGEKIMVLTRKANLYNIFNLSKSFKLNAEAAVQIPNNSFKSLSVQGDKLLIHTDKETFLYE